jgi:hypothetical protein
MAEINIKKIKDKIYEFDLTNSELVDGNEIVVNNNISEFVMTFRKQDLNKGVIVTPGGYLNGLVYKSSNDGEFYNNPLWMPDLVTFNFNVFGLKAGKFYRLTVVSRDTGKNEVITSDRSLVVTNEERELLIDANVAGVESNTDYQAIFRTDDTETHLFFKIGKIYISNVIIEEVELVTDEDNAAEKIPDTLYGEGKLRLVAHGIFTTNPQTNEQYKGRYIPMSKYTGKGINLYYDTTTNQYIIERDNANDVLEESFTNLAYTVDININKVVNKGHFSQYNIVEVNPDISPNTLKSGYIVFDFVDDAGKTVKYTNDSGRIAIMIYRLF